MAKGNMFLGIVSGKIGDSVGYKVTNSRDKIVQGWRPYRSEVANPKTEPQAIQRMKMAPALNFYRQLSRILDNAWQGQRYGNKSREFFMSMAMKQTSGIPFIVKGDKRFYPGIYPVAQGSLVRQSVTAISSNLLTTSIVSGGVTGTWGAVSQGIINKNFGIKNGDKLTFIFVGTTAVGEYVPSFSYVVLDTASTEEASAILGYSNLSFTGAVDANLQVGIVNAVDNIVAGAVILSRLDPNSGTTWQRSNSEMFCTEAYLDLMMSGSAYATALASYMSSDNFQSDWYLNEGMSFYYISPGQQGQSGTNLTVVSVDNIQFTYAGYSRQAAVATMSDGTKRAYRTNGEEPHIVVMSQGQLTSVGLQANDGVLAVIKETDSSVVGWIVVNDAETGGTVIEEP